MSLGGHTGGDATLLAEVVDERCPTCGQPVQVVTGREGTSHYEAAVLREAVDQVNALRVELAAAREALREARDCISSPTRPFAEGQDIYDTPMMVKALRRIDAALDATGRQE